MCIFWGTTYLGFKIALETIGPMAIVCIRNTMSGVLILSFARWRGLQLPQGRDLWLTAGYGILTIGIGNGTLAVAELWTPSGLASLFITTSPFLYAVVDALLPGGERMHGPTILGLLVGFAGVLYLVAPSAIATLSDGSFASGGGIVLGFVLLQFSGTCWALGSLLQRNRRLTTNPFVIAGTQQLATGIAFAIPALFEPQPAAWSSSALWAIVYLALFGGILGYGSYMTALSRLPIAIVSIYTYVNPVVAVFLGWLVYSEPFGANETAAMVVIFLGVWLVRRASASAQKLRAQRAASSGE